MKFLQGIISKSGDPAMRGPYRRNPEDIAERLRNTRATSRVSGDAAPKFSRNPNKFVREPIDDIGPKTSLTELVDQWRMDEDHDYVEDIEVEDPPAITEPIAQPDENQRVKTRLIGFDSAKTPDPFETTHPTPKAPGSKYPVGWLVVTKGPGRGECFTLLAGMSQIGRGEDQAVQLDFGDEAISRSNHAAIVYDIETHKFLLGHGGKANIVRLNNCPLITTEPLSSGDEIRIGETHLKLVVLSTPDFNWADPSEQEVLNVADA